MGRYKIKSDQHGFERALQEGFMRYFRARYGRFAWIFGAAAASKRLARKVAEGTRSAMR